MTISTYLLRLLVLYETYGISLHLIQYLLLYELVVGDDAPYISSSNPGPVDFRIDHCNYFETYA